MDARGRKRSLKPWNKIARVRKKKIITCNLYLQYQASLGERGIDSQETVPTKGISILIQRFAENMKVVPMPYLRDKTPPLVESKAFDLDDNLRLRPTLESERTALYRNQGKDPAKGSSRDIDNLCCVIEATTISMSPFDSGELQNAVQRTRLVWLALLLYFARIIKVKSWTSTPGKFVELGPNPEWAKCTSPTWSFELPMLEKFNDPITYRELEKFRPWWCKFESLGPKPTFLLRALDRFGFATGVYGEGMDVYQFVDYVTALEALLGESNEAQFKLSLRMAVLLGGSDEDHQNVLDFMKEAYNIRSVLVHGRFPDEIKVRSTQIKPTEALGRLHWYSRRCIWRVIALLILLKESPESEKVWLQLNDDKLRHRVAGLLDYCLVREDMRKNLTDVLSNGSDPTILFKQYDDAVGGSYPPSMLEESNEKERKKIHLERY